MKLVWESLFECELSLKCSSKKREKKTKKNQKEERKERQECSASNRAREVLREVELGRRVPGGSSESAARSVNQEWPGQINC